LDGLRENQGSQKQETNDCQLCGSADSDAVPLRLPIREKLEASGNALHADRFGPMDRLGCVDRVDPVDPVDLILPGWERGVFVVGDRRYVRPQFSWFCFRNRRNQLARARVMSTRVG